jgi:uncharacterized membrane protein YbhN (UPF0104 family)
MVIALCDRVPLSRPRRNLGATRHSVTHFLSLHIRHLRTRRHDEPTSFFVALGSTFLGVRRITSISVPNHRSGPDAPASGRSAKATLGLLIRGGGILIAVVAIGLLVRALVEERHHISFALQHANIWLLVLALVVSFFGPGLLATMWWRTLAAFDEHPRLRDAVAWFFAGEMGKYVPGGVWAVLGRGELSSRGGVRRTVAYASTLISMVLMCVGAAAVCGVMAPFLAFDGQGVQWELGLVVLLPVGIIAVHPRIFGRVLAVAAKASKGRANLSPPPFPVMLRLILWACPSWIAIGAASALVTEALGYHQHPLRVAFAAIAAWIIGFLVIPVPGGFGVREIVFIAVCGLSAGNNHAEGTVVAAIARVLLIIADAAGGFTGLVYARAQVAKKAPADPGLVLKTPTAG